MAFHIGKLILQHLDSLGINKSEFARRIGVTPQNVYSIFKRPSISTDLLQKVSKALSFDFFQYYTDGIEPGDLLYESQAGVAELTRETEALRREADWLKKENEYLKMLNELLRDRNSGKPEAPVDDAFEAKQKKKSKPSKPASKKKKSK